MSQSMCAHSCRNCRWLDGANSTEKVIFQILLFEWIFKTIIKKLNISVTALFINKVPSILVRYLSMEKIFHSVMKWNFYVPHFVKIDVTLLPVMASKTGTKTKTAKKKFLTETKIEPKSKQTITTTENNWKPKSKPIQISVLNKIKHIRQSKSIKNGQWDYYFSISILTPYKCDEW